MPTKKRARARTAACFIPVRSRRTDGRISKRGMTSRIITEAALDLALASLIKADARFKEALARAGRPPLRKRPDGFAGLAAIAVSQQLSTASARAIWGRLEAAL